MAAGPKEDPNALPFEGHLEALERIVSDLEGDALSLEASIERYRTGVDHLSACRRILDGAEKRLAELVARADGTGADEKPLTVGPDGLVDAPAPRAGIEDAKPLPALRSEMESKHAKVPAPPKAARKAPPLQFGSPPETGVTPADGDIPF